MPAYRFCRPDDIPLLVRALEECWRVHFPDEPAMTVERFRREMKELDVWPSNSMVALGGAGGDEPIAVSIGTKRASEVLVHRVGVRPDHLRQGHGRHLITSLGQKLAVLGPPRLVAEVPTAPAGAEAFFAALGYRREAVFADYRREPRPSTGGGGGGAGSVPEGLVTEVAVADLDATGALDVPADAAWQRSRETLVQSADRLRAVAVVSPERVEAWLVYLPGRAGGEVRVVGAGAAGEPAQRNLLLRLLFQWLEGRQPGPLRLPRLKPEELPETLLRELGLVRSAEYARWVATAQPL